MFLVKNLDYANIELIKNILFPFKYFEIDGAYSKSNILTKISF